MSAIMRRRKRTFRKYGFVFSSAAMSRIISEAAMKSSTWRNVTLGEFVRLQRGLIHTGSRSCLVGMSPLRAATNSDFAAAACPCRPAPLPTKLRDCLVAGAIRRAGDVAVRISLRGHIALRWNLILSTPSAYWRFGFPDRMHRHYACGPP